MMGSVEIFTFNHFAEFTQSGVHVRKQSQSVSGAIGH